MTFRSEFVVGARDIFPILPGFFSFGVVAGYAAVDAGLSPEQAIGMAVVIYSGVAQLAALELLNTQAPTAIIVLTALIVNVRYFMYSAAIAPYFERLTVWWQALFAYLLITANFVLSVDRWDQYPTRNRKGYYLGTSVPFWLTWVVATIIGIVFGTRIPGEWQLGFVVPLAFIALLVPDLTDRSSFSAAAVAGTIAVVGTGIPFRLGIVIATVAGTAVGLLVEVTKQP